MKKIASLLISVALLAAMLTVFAVPASAEDAPTVIDPSHIDDIGMKGGNYIITEDCEVSQFAIDGPNAQNSTLTIAEGVTVTVTKSFNNKGTINVFGTLILSDTVNNILNRGTIRIIGCGGGTMLGTFKSPGGTVTTYDDHVFADGVCSLCGTYECEVTGVHNFVSGVCSLCGHVCDNPFHNDQCPDCGMSKNGVVATGSTLSEGSLVIVVGVAGIAVGLVGGLLIGRKKKKPALAGGENTDEE